MERSNWYVCWLIMFLVHELRWPWVVLSGSMALYFDAHLEYAKHHKWNLPRLSHRLVWLPLIVAWRRKRAR